MLIIDEQPLATGEARHIGHVRHARHSGGCFSRHPSCLLSARDIQLALFLGSNRKVTKDIKRIGAYKMESARDLALDFYLFHIVASG